jgi:hypothetical protein
MKKNVEELLLHTANIYNNKVALLWPLSVLTDHNNYYVSRSSNTTTSHDLNVDDDGDDDNISEYSMLSPIPSSSSSSTMIINPTLLLPLSLYISQDKINQSFTRSSIVTLQGLVVTKLGLVATLSFIHLKPLRRFIHGVDNSIDLQVDAVDGVKRQRFDVDVIRKYLFYKSCC